MPFLSRRKVLRTLTIVLVVIAALFGAAYGWYCYNYPYGRTPLLPEGNWDCFKDVCREVRRPLPSRGRLPGSIAELALQRLRLESKG